MAMHPRAGQKAQQEDLHNIPALVANYFLLQPDANNAEHKVQFGTSGHRGTADKQTLMKTTFLLSHKQLQKYVPSRELQGRCLWAKIPTRCQNLRFQA